MRPGASTTKKAFGLGVKDRTPLGFCDKRKCFLGFRHHSPELSYGTETGDAFSRAAYEGDLNEIKQILRLGKQKVNYRDSKER